ncbi:cytochrome c family protein [Rhizobium sp. SG741]|uniref:c-type cytochrome n=1 Tax=unclassified Rhizobium TaxID=2613769 RepID=UPI0017EE8A0E|nr:cytochrome c [Rhizobium sp. SG741]NKJ36824.1 cytochrome c [Rhizobium sp. SG570]
MRKYLCLLALGWMAIAPAASNAWADGDPDRGQKLFTRCSACHAATEQNKVGPGLLGVVGRAAGTAEGYSYSAAMKSSGIIWDEGTLDAFLRSPSGVVKGTRMAILVPKDQDRGDLIAYLKTLTAH